MIANFLRQSWHSIWWKIRLVQRIGIHYLCFKKLLFLGCKPPRIYLNSSSKWDNSLTPRFMPLSLMRVILRRLQLAQSIRLADHGALCVSRSLRNITCIGLRSSESMKLSHSEQVPIRDLPPLVKYIWRRCGSKTNRRVDGAILICKYTFSVVWYSVK